VDFEQLKIFISVVENGGFTKAADALYISHSTTSRKVAALEESLNVRLFERDTRSVRLTEAGKLLYNESRMLLQRVEEIESAVRNVGNGYSGRLRAAGPNIFSDDLSGLYKEFCDLYPGIVLEVRSCGLSEVFGLVGSDRADFGFTFSYVLPENSEEYEIVRVAGEKFCVVVPEGHPLAERGSVTVKDLRTIKYISVGEQRSTFTRRLEDHILKGRPRSDVLFVSTLESLFMQVRRENGISLVPYPVARIYGTQCALLDIEDMDTRFDLVVFWRKKSGNRSLPLFAELAGDCTRRK